MLQRDRVKQEVISLQQTLNGQKELQGMLEKLGQKENLIMFLLDVANGMSTQNQIILLSSSRERGKLSLLNTWTDST